MPNKKEAGTLYIVATPIGNPKDITLRALDMLEEADAVICEEYRQGSRLLHQLGMDEKELVTLNEHNEKEVAQKLAQRLARGESMALISDAGTPVFADPGQHLIGILYQMKIPVKPVPGPASLIAALSLCDFCIDRFIFAGFPPRKTQGREGFLKKYTMETIPVILMDTPYRLTKLLSEVRNVFGAHQEILLACDMTLRTEAIYRGQVGDILPKVSGQKREFILILNMDKRKRKRS